MNKEIYFHRILRPHRALSIEGQKITLYLLLTLLLVLAPPILASGAWILFFFLLAPVVFLFLAFYRRNHDTQLYEELTITRDALTLEHVKPNGEVLRFDSDFHWVKVQIEPKGPVESYLTLKDHDRHVELGRFLSPEERKELYQDLLALKAKF